MVEERRGRALCRLVCLTCAVQATVQPRPERTHMCTERSWGGLHGVIFGFRFARALAASWTLDYRYREHIVGAVIEKFHGL